MKKQSASALLIVLGMIGIVCGVLLHAWFLASLRFDIVSQREQTWVSFYTVSAALNYGLGSVREQFAAFATQASNVKKPLVIDVSSLLFDVQRAGQKALVFIKKPIDTQMRNALLVHACLYHHDRCVSAVACVLRKQAMRNQESRFVVSHFTVSPRV